MNVGAVGPEARPVQDQSDDAVPFDATYGKLKLKHQSGGAAAMLL